MLSANRFTQKHLYSLATSSIFLRRQRNYLLDTCSLYCEDDNNYTLERHYFESIRSINLLNQMKDRKIEFVEMFCGMCDMF